MLYHAFLRDYLYSNTSLDMITYCRFIVHFWLYFRFQVVQSLWSTGLESTYGLYPYLSKLLCLLEIEEASVARVSAQDHAHLLNDLSFLQDIEECLLE